jgi:hypothetical protein
MFTSMCIVYLLEIACDKRDSCLFHGHDIILSYISTVHPSHCICEGCSCMFSRANLFSFSGCEVVNTQEFSHR